MLPGNARESHASSRGVILGWGLRGSEESSRSSEHCPMPWVWEHCHLPFMTCCSCPLELLSHLLARIGRVEGAGQVSILLCSGHQHPPSDLAPASPCHSSSSLWLPPGSTAEEFSTLASTVYGLAPVLWHSLTDMMPQQVT